MKNYIYGFLFLFLSLFFNVEFVSAIASENYFPEEGQEKAIATKILLEGGDAGLTKQFPLNKEYSIGLDKETIAKGYTVEAFDALRFSLVPGILSEATQVEVLELNEEMPLPWNLEKISNIYQFEFKNKSAYDNHKPFYIQFNYDEESYDYKQVYFFDKNFNSWRPLPTRDYPREKFVRSLIHLPFARLAIFSDDERMSSGRASWYAYRGGDFAASPDFPKGSVLRVVNMDNDKFVDVTINDYGPDRAIHPDRVIDLDKIAFSKIASLGAGIIDVRIEPLVIVPDSHERVVGVSAQGLKDEPILKSRAAIVYDEQSGEVLFEKNSNDVIPLASLTKLVSLKVFLETEPDFNQVVEYKNQDLEYNYDWVERWEAISRLRTTEGETMTIGDLFYTSLIGSANNTIESLVRVSGLERKDFIAKMNETVRSWGATSTLFFEPTGLSPQNVTTPYEYALIMKNVFEDRVIREGSVLPRYEFTTIKSGNVHKIKNTNNIDRNYSYLISGSKTGYLHESLHCLALRISDPNGGNFFVITMGSETKSLSNSESEMLIKFGQKLLAK